MVNESVDEFFHSFRQQVMANAAANEDFVEAEFTQIIANELVDAGFTDGFEPCHYRLVTGGVRVDGYFFNEDSVDLFITDFANRENLQSLTQTDVNQIFKRLENFFVHSIEKRLYAQMEETSPAYGLSRQISDQRSEFSRVNLFLISERTLSDRLRTLDDHQHSSWTFSYQIWDITRLHRLHTSRGAREALEINFTELMEMGLPCLPAHLNSASYKSYLAVIPASVLVYLYEKYGSRLLEQNVRSFLQVRGNVNKGIRSTIINDPEMFFAYNNGITATAKQIETINSRDGTYIVSLKDLQIVNGGQTTASLFYTHRKDKAKLDKIFVQMKLSIIDEDKAEEVVPRISEYANTQNKVNAADFFSNHPFHIRIEEFSRRLWAPARQGAQRETKWFYERARGQYADNLNKRSPGEKKRFEAEYPKAQMFTKTDLAKFENVWDEKPRFVNLGAQKNFVQYATRIGQEWEKKPDQFNEFYFKRAIARAIIFRRTEQIVSDQPWYDGYRANIVAYTIAILGKICEDRGVSVDFIKIWNQQDISPAMASAITITSKIVRDDILNPGVQVSHIGEWCKRDACWIQLQKRTQQIIDALPRSFIRELLSKEDILDTTESAVRTQKMANGIEAQKQVLAIPAETWALILKEGQKKRLYSDKEIGVLQVAVKIPEKIPTEKQSFVLLEVLEKAKLEAIYHE